ncbi:hypothetical protein EZV73_25800 [Acidaminobacter sp. JC074]|uniref:hypothetical protein n=1 Tax=Acidaminobacter sp. JC074 TaxID=2530199 RepID=UPI001F0FF42F|nr:hypothetical protein [Acidaminobacter sp. JC074]MCH4891018.1 hypothetical protein [Acidaminobacter sp. JC074]
MTVDSSIPFKDLEAYFKDKENVRLIKNPDRLMGSIRIPSTSIVVEGDQAEKIVEAYRMAFLTAGG